MSFFLPYDENVILFHLALTFAHDFDLSSVILKEDSEIVINGLKNEDVSFALILWSLGQRGEIFSGILYCFFVFYILRQDNFIAHNIARHVSGFLVSMENIPWHPNAIILADIADII